MNLTKFFIKNPDGTIFKRLWDLPVNDEVPTHIKLRLYNRIVLNVFLKTDDDAHSINDDNEIVIELWQERNYWDYTSLPSYQKKRMALPQKVIDKIQKSTNADISTGSRENNREYHQIYLNSCHFNDAKLVCNILREYVEDVIDKSEKAAEKIDAVRLLLEEM